MAIPPPPPGVLVDIASGVLLLALGAFVGTVKPRRTANVAFAIFSGTVGVGFVSLNLAFGADSFGGGAYADLLFALTGTLFVVGCAALPAAVSPLVRRPRRARAFTAAALGVAPMVAVSAWTIASYREYGATYGLQPTLAVAAQIVGLTLLLCVLWGVVIFLSVGAVGADDRAFHQAGLAAAGLALWPAFTSANSLLARNAWDLGFGLAALLAAGIVAAVWLRQSARGRAPAFSRNVALACLSAMLVGLAAVPLSGGFLESQATGGFGIARTIAVVILAYGIVRYQLFDIDLKIKWTIARGTIAAAFLAVFFIVAQLGQNYLTGELGWALGGVAAGLMLFAITPLQKAAERVADVAMPGVKATPQYVASRKEESFRFAVRMAYADRVLSREEERNLANLAADLGIDAARAYAVREEVEREIGLAPTPAGPA